MLETVILVAWLSPFFFASLVVFGRAYNKKRRTLLAKESSERKIEKVIFQVPTIGNVQTVNKILETVKGYSLPVPVETWVVVEEWDVHKSEYKCDKLVVVPSSFECEDLYKSRALEYARRLRKKLVEEGSLTPNYLLLQGDDDSLPSKDFIEECLQVKADIVIGTITPKVKGAWNTILDYERCVACGVVCNFFTNVGKPVWAHGEGTCVSSAVDQNVSYDISDISPNTKTKLLSSEDLFYLHKASVKGFTAFNSEKRVFIIPPLTFNDAVKQRRRWLWGHIRILKEKLLPLPNRLRLAFFEFFGLGLFTLSTLGVPLHYLGLITMPETLLPFTWSSLLLWFGIRGYAIGKNMGLKHAITGVLTSYATVTLNFIVNAIGLIKGDPKKFDVIEKQWVD
jgi:hypothetical protein